jgi:hypothetical protein
MPLFRENGYLEHIENLNKPITPQPLALSEVEWVRRQKKKI